MTRILFLTWPGAGNQVPALGLAEVLAVAGHEVIFAGYTAQRSLFERAGFGFRVLAESDRDWPAVPPDDWIPVLGGVVWANPNHLVDVPNVLKAEAPDVVVIDCLMYAAIAAAERSDVPSAVLVHSAPGAIAPPGGAMEAALMPAVNAVRDAAGRPRLEHAWDAWTAVPAICTSIPELDPMGADVPPGFHFVGPISTATEGGSWQSPWSAGDPRPLILVSFSTGPAWDQASRLQRTIDALDDGRHRVLACTGTTDPKALTVRFDAALVPYVPHAEVLPSAEAVVTHAGHGTVTAALGHGLPLVALPNAAADQPAMAAQVAALGAGIALDGDAASPAEIAAAVAAVLREESYRTAAHALGRAIADATGADAAASMLLELAAS